MRERLRVVQMLARFGKGRPAGEVPRRLAEAALVGAASGHGCRHSRDTHYALPVSTERRKRTPIPKAKGLTRTVSLRIRELRQARGLSQEELGRPYLTKSAVSSLERGVTAPSLHMLAFLAKKLKVTPRDLLLR